MVDFLIIGPINATQYDGVFRLMMDRKIRYGYRDDRLHFWFYVDPGGDELIDVSGIIWFTNLRVDYKRHLCFSRRYDKEEFRMYDGYDAINIDDVREMPIDYKGVMGVPTTFFKKWDPDEYQVLGYLRSGKGGLDKGLPLIDGKSRYVRILIKKI